MPGNWLWTAAEIAYVQERPGDWEGYAARFGTERRTYTGWRAKHRELGLPVPPAVRPGSPLRARPGATDVAWDKRNIVVDLDAAFAAAEVMQELAGATSGAQDFAQIAVASDRPVALLAISDWHIGSYGTNYRRIGQVMDAIERLDLRVCVLGDMIQMAIKLRNVLEMADNLLPPRVQMQVAEEWLERMAPRVLWATWDNHSVEREEAATGFSRYAQMFRERTVYHSGIGHVDLGVGDETYRLASSHRFRGNTAANPTGGQQRYMRYEGIDREIALAGDSHRPALACYWDGPLYRVALNCGAMQTASGYAARHFSLYTQDAMPVIVLWPDRHLIVPYVSVEAYEAAHAAPRVPAPAIVRRSLPPLPGTDGWGRARSAG